MVYTIQFNVLVMINYFGRDSKAEPVRMLGKPLVQLQLSAKAAAISQ